eukprot:2043004-Amphidinium_carterae.1
MGSSDLVPSRLSALRHDLRGSIAPWARGRSLHHLLAFFLLLKPSPDKNSPCMASAAEDSVSHMSVRLFERAFKANKNTIWTFHGLDNTCC